MIDADDPVVGTEMAASSLGRPGITTEESPATPPAVEEKPTVELPGWLLDADAEETRELEALGVVADPHFTEEAQRDVLVSSLLRARHEHEHDVSRYDAAEQLEHDQIAKRYDRLRAPARRQLIRLASFLIHLIEGATFSGKNKSRHVGWGSYGRRKTPDAVNLVNMPEVVAAVRTIKPAAVMMTVKVDAGLVADVDAVISQLISTAIVTEGASVSALSILRAALLAGDCSVSKTEVAKLLKADNPPLIPGVALVPGIDKPWFEVEAPANG